MKQLDLFETPVRTVVLRWKLGFLTASWRHGVRGFFPSWENALADVFHPLNGHVIVRIR